MNLWTSSAPIHQQLADQMVADVLEAGVLDGGALPSVLEIAKAYMVNPMIVSRALEYLNENGLIEARIGDGSYVCEGAKERIVAFGRKRFLENEWPVLRERLQRLRIQPSDLQ